MDMVAARRCGPLRRLNLLELRRVLPGVLPASILLMCLAGAVSTAPLAPPFTQHSMVAGPLRLRGGIMWVGGGRQFNRTVDPDAGPEAAVDTFEPLRVRAEAHNRIKALKSRQGAKFQSSEVITLEEEEKFLIMPQKMVRAKSLSINIEAGTSFQKFVVQDMEFQQQRVGILYGTCDLAGNVRCEAVYEPPQEGDAEAYKVLEDPDFDRVDRVAALLGLRIVGSIFTARSRKCILSSQDIMLAARVQERVEKRMGYDAARACVSGAISHNETTGVVSFEAYQISDLCMDLYRRGYFKEPTNSNRGYARTSEDVLVERKPTSKVDTDFFLNSVAIQQHTSTVFGGREAHFPVENRPTTGQNALEVKHILKCHEEMPFQKRVSDFHLLLFLSSVLDGVETMPALCKAVVENGVVADRHRQAVEAIAALA
ncbi:NPL4 family-domain-containing protein [Baffinella frigidus]|nr:NPL4 family-domain-containing protein [Cryptophyta sp. CCMP2293]